MRQPSEITHNGRSLALILSDHAAWLAEPAGEETHPKANLTWTDLRGANLTEADLTEANLTGAYLTGANLYGASGILSAGPLGSRGDTTYIVRHKTCLMVQCGCFWGTIEEFAAAVERTHGDNQYGREYKALIALAQVWGGEE